MPDSSLELPDPGGEIFGGGACGGREFGRGGASKGCNDIEHIFIKVTTVAKN